MVLYSASSIEIKGFGLIEIDSLWTLVAVISKQVGFVWMLLTLQFGSSVFRSELFGQMMVMIKWQQVSVKNFKIMTLDVFARNGLDLEARVLTSTYIFIRRKSLMDTVGILPKIHFDACCNKESMCKGQILRSLACN